jgi:hypothetical protein
MSRISYAEASEIPAGKTATGNVKPFWGFVLRVWFCFHVEPPMLKFTKNTPALSSN